MVGRWSALLLLAVGAVVFVVEEARGQQCLVDEGFEGVATIAYPPPDEDSTMARNVASLPGGGLSVVKPIDVYRIHPHRSLQAPQGSQFADLENSTWPFEGELGATLQGSGTVQLSLYVAGNHRNDHTDRVTIRYGNQQETLFIDRTDGWQRWTETITLGAPMAFGVASANYDPTTGGKPGWDVFGAHIDDVKACFVTDGPRQTVPPPPPPPESGSCGDPVCAGMKIRQSRFTLGCAGELDLLEDWSSKGHQITGFQSQWYRVDDGVVGALLATFTQVPNGFTHTHDVGRHGYLQVVSGYDGTTYVQDSLQYEIDYASHCRPDLQLDPTADSERPTYEFCANDEVYVGQNAVAHGAMGWFLEGAVIDWGDGFTELSDWPPGFHRYTAPGSYVIQERVFDQGGASDEEAVSIVVESCPPTAAFSWVGASTSCEAPVPVEFDVSFSHGVGRMGSQLTRYEMDFGDGQSVAGNWPPGPPFNHFYAAVAAYNVTLTVFDDHGQQASHNETVVAETLRCAPRFQTPEHCLAGSPDHRVLAGFTAAVPFVVASPYVVPPPAGPRPAQIVSVSILSPAAGQSVELAVPLPAAPAEGEFLWANKPAGRHSVVLEARDEFGAQAWCTLNIDTVVQTYAAGARLGALAVLAGDDPGCGLGDPAHGGLAAGDPYTATAIDPATMRSRPVPQLAEPAYFAAAATVEEGDGEALILAGGDDDQGPPCAFLPTARTQVLRAGEPWQVGPDLPVAVLAPAAAARAGTMYVFGGDSEGGDPAALPAGLTAASWHPPTAAVQAGDADGFVVLAPRMPAGVTGASAVWDAATQRVVVTGGAGHPQVPTRLVQRFDPATGDWDGENLAQARSAYEALECNGAAFVLGGNLGEQSTVYDSAAATADVVALNGSPVPIRALPAARTHLAGATVSTPQATSDRVVVTGGYASNGAISNDAYLTANGCPSPATNAWSHKTLLVAGTPQATPLRLAEHAAAYVGGRLVLVGGATPASGGCGTNGVASFDPALLFAQGPPGQGVVGTMTSAPFAMRASMGYATIDGRVLVLVGGRGPGLDSRGQPSPGCKIPVSEVWFYAPDLPAGQQWWQGPALPEGLIAPSVAVFGHRIVVTGGDEGGLFANPFTPLEPRPYRPNRDTYVLDWSGILSANSLDAWVEGPELPLGVMEAKALPVGTAMKVYGGHHHPLRSARVVQSIDVVAASADCIRPNPMGPCLVNGLPAPAAPRPVEDLAWAGTPMPEARQHHWSAVCSGGVLVGSGSASHPLYRSAVAGAFTGGGASLAGGAWTTTAVPAGGFAVAAKGGGTLALATGTTPAAHRSGLVGTLACG